MLTHPSVTGPDQVLPPAAHVRGEWVPPPGRGGTAHDGEATAHSPGDHSVLYLMTIIQVQVILKTANVCDQLCYCCLSFHLEVLHLYSVVYYSCRCTVCVDTCWLFKLLHVTHCNRVLLTLCSLLIAGFDTFREPYQRIGEEYSTAISLSLQL